MDRRRRTFVVVAAYALGLALFAVAIWATSGMAKRPREDEDWQESVRGRHFAAIAEMDRLLRLRGDVSREAERAARRDQLILMAHGLAADEAVAVLEVFAERDPGASPAAWTWAAYAWRGRRPQTARGRAYEDVEYFTRLFVMRKPDRQYAEAKASVAMISARWDYNRHLPDVHGIWALESELGLVARWDDESQPLWLTFSPEMAEGGGPLGPPPGGGVPPAKAAAADEP